MLSTVQVVSGPGSGDAATGVSWSRAERKCVMEIRSEHKLNDPTTFSILMVDVPDSEGARNRKLATGDMVAVLARPKEEGDWTVLFQGIVDEVDATHTQGGLGSTVLYRGRDIRMKLAGHSFTGAWSGQVNSVMERLLRLVFPETEVDAPHDFNDIEEDRNPLGQNSNHLDFLRTKAVVYGHNLWVSYASVPEATPSLSALNPVEGGMPEVTIARKAHWATSPYVLRAGEAGAMDREATPLNLTALAEDDDNSTVLFKVHVDRTTCPNVTAFQLTADERQVRTMPEASEGQSEPDDIPTPSTDPSSQNKPEAHFVPKAVDPTGGSGPASYAIDVERSFKVKARLSTTKALIKRLCFPHDLAAMQGLRDDETRSLDTKLFRIREATHVIRIDGHWMDVTLESDGETPHNMTENPVGGLL